MTEDVPGIGTAGPEDLAAMLACSERVEGLVYLLQVVCHRLLPVEGEVAVGASEQRAHLQYVRWSLLVLLMMTVGWVVRSGGSFEGVIRSGSFRVVRRGSFVRVVQGSFVEVVSGSFSVIQRRRPLTAGGVVHRGSFRVTRGSFGVISGT